MVLVAWGTRERTPLKSPPIPPPNPHKRAGEGGAVGPDFPG